MSRSIWLAGTIAIVLLTFAAQLRAPFELQDDHRIIEPVLHPELRPFTSYVNELRRDVDVVGRFRPVNQIFDVIGPFVFGPNPLVWHIVLLALAIAVTVLLFVIGDRLFQSPPAGAVLALITMLAPDPGPTAAWYRLGPKEAWGMLFLAIAVLLMIQRRRDAWVFLFVALAAYSKESFLLTVPALFAFRWWLAARDTKAMAALRSLWRVALAYALLFAIGLICVVAALKSAGAHSYGAKNLTMTPAMIANVFVHDAAFAPMLCAWFLPFLLSLVVRRPSLLAVFVFAAWVGPQYLLHATRGGFWDHYWLPCVAGFAMVNAYGMAVLQRSGWLRRLAFAAFALWTINALRIDIPAVLNHVEKARVQQQAVRVAIEHARPNADLLIVHDPQVQSETAPAFASFVAANGGRFRSARLADSHAPAIATNGAAVIVHLDDTRDAVPLAPGWSTIDVKGIRVYVSLRKRGLDAIPFRLRVDVKR